MAKSKKSSERVKVSCSCGAGLMAPKRGWLIALLGGAIAAAAIGDDADRYVRGAVGKAASMRASMRSDGSVSGSVET